MSDKMSGVKLAGTMCFSKKNQHLEVEIFINCGVSKCLLHFFENCF